MGREMRKSEGKLWKEFKKGMRRKRGKGKKKK